MYELIRKANMEIKIGLIKNEGMRQTDQKIMNERERKDKACISPTLIFGKLNWQMSKLLVILILFVG